jgi:plastocyanin
VEGKREPQLVGSRKGRSMKKLVVVGFALALVAGAVSLAFATTPGNTITTVGDESFQPNALIQSTFRWDPGSVDVKSGDRIKFVYGNEGHDPHTISIVNQDQLPTKVAQVFNCKVCNEIFKIQDGQKRVLGPDGGLNEFGDTIFFPPGATTSVKVTAPAGTTLYFLCAIHPWMQGKIFVT